MSAARESFAEAVMPAADLVYNLARRLSRRSADAEDLTQETLAKAWEAWLRGTRPDATGAWLSTICLNLARDRARRAGRRPEVAWPDGHDPVAPTDVEGEALTRALSSTIEQALWTLPEPQRVAITLMDICGFSAAETAAVLQAPRGTILARVHRGRKALALAVRGRQESHPTRSSVPGPADPAAAAPGTGGQRTREPKRGGRP